MDDEQGTVEGLSVLEAASQMEGLIDDAGLVIEDQEHPEESDDSEDEPEAEDDASEEPEEVEVEDADDDDEDSEETSDDAEDEEPAHLDLTDDTLDSFVTIKVNGEDQEVTLREALAGTMRQKAFTLKTQELAEQRKAVEAEVVARREERQRYADGLERLESAMKAIVPEELSVEDIKAMSPEAIEAHKAVRTNLEQIQAERERVQQEAAEEAETLMLQKQVERDEFLTTTIPGWSDLDKARSEMAELVSYAQENYGYSLKDISRTVDPQAFVLLRKAKLYDEMTEKGEKVRKKAKKSITLKPGSAGSSKESKSKKEKEAARSRLSKTGELAAAAKVFEDFIE